MKRILVALGILVFIGQVYAGWEPEYNCKFDGDIAPLFAGGMEDAKPRFYDLDTDGDADLLWGVDDGYIKLWENVGTASIPDWRMRDEHWGNVSREYDACPALGDLDDDGDLDLILGGWNGQMAYYENTGGTALYPEFTLIEDYFLGYDGVYGAKPFLADINADSDLDLFIGDSRGKIAFYENIGTADSFDFTLVDSEFVVLDPNHVNPCLFDIDLDGDFDLVIQQGNDFHLVKNIGNASNPVWDTPDDSYFPHTPSSVGGVAIWDLFNSGLPALVMGSDIHLDYLYTNTGTINSPTWEQAPWPWETIETSYSTHIAMADLNDDNLPEMLLFGYHYKLGLRNIGTAGDPDWTVDSSLVDGLWGASADPAFGDLDSDGDLDIVMGGIGDSLRYFENIGDRCVHNWAAPVTGWFGISLGNHLGPALVDIDSDNDLDLFVGTASESLYFFENTGDSTTPNFSSGVYLSEFPETPWWGPLYRANLCFEDFDNDGDYDLFTGASFDEHKLTFWENTGDSTAPEWGVNFVEDFLENSTGGLYDVCFWDYNNDGVKDLICSTVFGGVLVYLWDGPLKVAERKNIPGKFELLTYPNPFNSAVYITAPAGAGIEIFDVNGRRVSVIARPKATAISSNQGDYFVGQSPSRNDAKDEFVWQPDKTIGSGVYLIRAKIGEKSITRRAVYLK
ncbi:T9SS type A sorting domain-containing protein [bacterium]|nr:T9SS type A sorting domain-containing protein [bacterium]